MDKRQVDEHPLADAFRDSLRGMDALAELMKNDVPKLPESLFVSKLLPILTNTEGHQDITVWHEIAGTTLRPIDVVDDRTKEVLFRVPAMARQIEAKVTGRGKHSAFHVLTVAKQKHEVLPALGDQHIRSTLVQAVTESPPEMDQVRQWNDILVRYGHPPVLDVPKTPEKESAVEESDTLFSGDYDEL